VEKRLAEVETHDPLAAFPLAQAQKAGTL
jgi:hypothetical protein